MKFLLNQFYFSFLVADLRNHLYHQRGATENEGIATIAKNNAHRSTNAISRMQLKSHFLPDKLLRGLTLQPGEVEGLPTKGQ